MKRITESPHLARQPGGHNLAWYIDRIERSSSRWEAESRLLQALDDPALSDDDYHQTRVHFDGRVKGWLR